MQPLFEHRLKLDGYETRALELEGDGTPLILIHGYADSADTWRLLLDRLGKADRRAIAVDLPGFGEASPLQHGPILPQYDAFARALVNKYADECGEPVIVAGNSLGGVVSLRTAEHTDLPLAGVVPIGPAGLEMPRWFELIERDPIVRSVLALPLPIPKPVLRELVGQVYRQLAFSRPWTIDGRVLAAFAQHHSTRAEVADLLNIGRRLLPELVDPFEFERTCVPVLLVWGTRDRMVSVKGAEKIRAALPNTRIELLEGWGHCPQIEVPERIHALLDDFIEAAALAA